MFKAFILKLLKLIFPVISFKNCVPRHTNTRKVGTTCQPTYWTKISTLWLSQRQSSEITSCKTCNTQVRQKILELTWPQYRPMSQSQDQECTSHLKEISLHLRLQTSLKLSQQGSLTGLLERSTRATNSKKKLFGSNYAIYQYFTLSRSNLAESKVSRGVSFLDSNRNFIKKRADLNISQHTDWFLLTTE